MLHTFLSNLRAKETTNTILNNIVHSLFIFTIIITLTTTALGISYYATIKALKGNIISANQKSVSQLEEISSARIAEISHIVEQISNYYMTSYVLTLDHNWDKVDANDKLKAQEYGRFLKTVSIPSDIIADAIVYSDHGEQIFRGEGVLPAKKWYNNAFSSPSFQYNDWNKVVKNAQGEVLRKCIYLQNGSPLEVIPYVQKLPLGSKKQFSGYICLLLNPSIFFTEGGDRNTDNAFLVLDRNKKLIVDNDKGFEDLSELHLYAGKNKYSYTQYVEGHRQLISYVRSQNGLYFVVISSYVTVLRPATFLQSIFIIMLIICILTVVFSSILVFRRAKNPISQLLLDNISLQEQIEKQQGEARSSQISLLLSGYLVDEQECKKALGVTGIPVSPDNQYVVVCLQISCEGSYDIITAVDLPIIKAQIRSLLQSEHTFCSENSYGFLTMISSTNDAVKEQKQIMSLLLQLKDIYEEKHILIYATGGQFYPSIAKISTSYNEALYLLRTFYRHEAFTIQWYYGPDTEQLFYYPAELEQQLIISARCGDRKIVNELIDKIYTMNYIRLKINMQNSRLLILRLKTTLLTISSEIKELNNDFRTQVSAFVFTEEKKSVDANFRQFYEFYTTICHEVYVEQNQRTQDLKNDLVQFIDQHCFDINMSLTLVADEYGLSENYVSSFFKEQTGVNFLTHVEDKRLKKGCLMLADNTKTIDEIAYAIGYGSSHSFRRAFKRKYNINPADYRNLNNK